MRSYFFVSAASGIALSLLMLPACRRDVDERLGLDDKRAALAFDVTSLARDGELEKALATPAAEVARKLGTYRFAQTSRLTMTIGERQEVLDETWKLEEGDKGTLHLLRETSRGEGFETIVVGDSIYVKPRYGRFVRRLIEGDEVERTRESAQDVFASYLSVLGRYAARKDLGAVSHGGRPARKVGLSLGTAPARFGDIEPGHAWRQSMKVSALAGEVTVDAVTGAPLSATLEATYVAPRTDSDHPGDMTVAISYRGLVDGVGTVAEVAPPADAAPPPVRVRPMLDKQVLLEGLVTPVAPAATRTAEGK